MDLWHLLIGRPLRAREAATEEIGVGEGLAALSLDALSSVAYGPEAIAWVLLAGGTAALSLLLPLSLVIVGLLTLLVLSYSQVIAAYPQGGGSYAVARQNLGKGASLVAGAALLVDYVLTVAVSVAAGVAALTSAFPSLLPWTLPLCLGVLALLTILNLRGVGESARAFLLPTVVFIAGILVLVVIGLTRSAAAGLPLPTLTVGGLGTFLALKAFAAGCTALTGVEAIANGVPLFREPRVVRARRTEWLLGSLLALMLIGLAILAVQHHLRPTLTETLLSRTLRSAVGRTWPYYVVSMATTAVLGLAANTSFGGLPLLASLLARDNYLPHVFAIRGDRLVYQTGIWVLAGAAAVLLIAVDGNTEALIPLFAIGVFTGFTLSQTGMVVHWWRERPRGWPLRAGLNGLGAVVTGLATLVFIVTKFGEGAFLVVILVPLLVLMFLRIRHYYTVVGQVLEIGAVPTPVRPRPRPLVLVPLVPQFSTLTRRALEEALALSDEVIAITVFTGERSAEDVEAWEQAWARWNPPVRLVTLASQYHSVIRPMLRFVASVERREGQRLWVLVPEVIPDGPASAFLHNRLGTLLAAALRRRTNAVVGLVPFHLRERPRASAPPNTQPSEPPPGEPSP